jgi:hypothetical protein
MSKNETDPHPDIIGKEYGKLTVVGFEGFKFRGEEYLPRYSAICLCSRRKIIYYPDLKRRGQVPCPYCKTLKVREDMKLVARRKGFHPARAALEKAKQKAQAAVAKDYKIDIEHVTRMLLNDREYARTGKLLYEDGRPDEPPPDRAKLDPRAAVQATQSLAAMHGLVTKRTEITIVNTIEKMRDDELIDFIGKLKEKLDRYEALEAIELNKPPAPKLIEQPVTEIIGYGDEE